MSTSREFQNLGYDVFLGGPKVGFDGDQLQSNSENQGFKFIKIEFQNGYIGKKSYAVKSGSKKIYHTLKNIKELSLFKSVIHKNKIKFVLLDINYVTFILGFQAIGVPVIFLSTVLLSDRSITAPPLTQFTLNRRNQELKINELWENEVALKNYFQPFYKALNQLAIFHKIKFIKYFYKDICIAAFGWRLPEIICWPKSFEFYRPNVEYKNKYHIGAQIDILRKEQRLENLDVWVEKIPLIYISFGTQIHENKVQLLNQLLTCIKEINCYKFIVQHPYLRSNKTYNLWIVKYAPQIQILSNASLMISHGGGNNIKECMYFGVPMICYPFENDQFGNASRVIHFKLGQLGKFSEDNNFLEKQIYEVLNDPNIRKNVLKFQKEAIRDNKDKRYLKLIENLMTNYNYYE